MMKRLTSEPARHFLSPLLAAVILVVAAPLGLAAR
jgi:hypothetical protein